MSLVIDRREMGVVGFRDQDIKKKDVIMVARGFPGFFGTGFHGKHGWVHEEKRGERLDGFHVGLENGEFSSESSSIGGCSNSTVDDSDNEEGEVHSRFRSPLDQMNSLEDSLPIKRGLSNYFSGKAKSFGCLSDAVSVEDLSKTEKPLNKRRRILLACKMEQESRARCSVICVHSDGRVSWKRRWRKKKNCRTTRKMGKERTSAFPHYHKEGSSKVWFLRDHIRYQICINNDNLFLLDRFI